MVLGQPVSLEIFELHGPGHTQLDVAVVPANVRLVWRAAAVADSPPDHAAVRDPALMQLAALER